MKKWIVTAVDHDIDGNCDGKARIVGACNSLEEARALVRNAIEEWVDENAEEGVGCDFDKMSAWYDYDSSNRCEWNIEDIEI